MFLIEFDDKIVKNDKNEEKHVKIMKLDAYSNIDIDLRED